MENFNQLKNATLSNVEYETRRFTEMKKRIGLLQYRKERLMHELNAINSALSSLNKQVSHHSTYKQLSI
tara:strand:+ start:31 stop:237 length:207 start_codon:yes stop_codon:yes gene_type:complete